MGQDDEVLEIGSGWVSLAMEVVKQTGCKYTGVTQSVEQLKYAQRRVKEAGLEVAYYLLSLPFTSSAHMIYWNQF